MSLMPSDKDLYHKLFAIEWISLNEYLDETLELVRFFAIKDGSFQGWDDMKLFDDLACVAMVWHGSCNHGMMLRSSHHHIDVH